MDTICAISTPAGVGGIAVIRVAGEQAFPIVERLFRGAHGALCLQAKVRRALYGELVDPTTQQAVDEVVVTAFQGPHSFTGDDVVEISCHGSIFIQQEVLRLLLEAGCRMANPGEFTQRAFLNGKMDLSQAEAVADLISSTSAANNRLAMQQMKGHFSAALNELREQLLNLMALVELELDFSEEDVEFADRSQLRDLVVRIANHVERLANSFRQGNAIKNGLPVAIVGQTNVGKSTLLNALLGEERALVSDVHGTTRDTIEDTLSMGGMLFRFTDTAGIRETDDVVENMGISRTYAKAEEAQVVLMLLDATAGDLQRQLDALVRDLQDHLKGKTVLGIINKTDAQSDVVMPKADGVAQWLPISARCGQGLEALREALIVEAQKCTADAGDVVVTNLRHYEALTQALESIRRVEQGLQDGISGDFLAQDIRECTHYLGTITGQITTDEVLHSIFARFCIGK